MRVREWGFTILWLGFVSTCGLGQDDNSETQGDVALFTTTEAAEMKFDMIKEVVGEDDWSIELGENKITITSKFDCQLGVGMSPVTSGIRTTRAIAQDRKKNVTLAQRPSRFTKFKMTLTFEDLKLSELEERIEARNKAAQNADRGSFKNREEFSSAMRLLENAKVPRYNFFGVYVCRETSDSIYVKIEDVEALKKIGVLKELVDYAMGGPRNSLEE